MGSCVAHKDLMPFRIGTFSEGNYRTGGIQIQQRQEYVKNFRINIKSAKTSIKSSKKHQIQAKKSSQTTQISKKLLLSITPLSQIIQQKN